MLQRDSAHLQTPFRGETGNLILKLPGTCRGPRRMFSTTLIRFLFALEASLYDANRSLGLRIPRRVWERTIELVSGRS